MNTDKDVSISIKRLKRGKFPDLITGLQEEYDYVCEERDRMVERLKAWNRDEEIQKAHEKADYYRDHSLEMLTDKELEECKAFRYSHYESCKNNGSFLYELTGTGIGTIIKIICPVCGESKDVTDIDAW